MVRMTAKMARMRVIFASGSPAWKGNFSARTVDAYLIPGFATGKMTVATLVMSLVRNAAQKMRPAQMPISSAGTVRIKVSIGPSYV